MNARISAPWPARSPQLPQAVYDKRPIVWFNALAGQPGNEGEIGLPDVALAVDRWERSAGLLMDLFPELGMSGGHIDSPLVPLSASLATQILGGRDGAVLVKADNELPLTGSIKARGGIYEVLTLAEGIARDHGLMSDRSDLRLLATTHARSVFAEHQLVVGSTGNLGVSIGLIGRALGFRVRVHMSRDAKQWKKDKLAELGVEIVEHHGDYSAAVTAARASSAADRTHFIDDERSPHLFVGYATAALDLRRQLDCAGVVLNAARPLVVYLPCGVGGAPGGITFMLKKLFGNYVICVFAEPVEAPSMLVQLASGLDSPFSVYAAGLTNRTDADGLAVPLASMFVAQQIERLVDAVVTVTDHDLYRWAYVLWHATRLLIEPSGAAGFAAVGPFVAALGSGLSDQHLENATHIVWATGGSQLPPDELEALLLRGRSE